MTKIFKMNKDDYFYIDRNEKVIFVLELNFTKIVVATTVNLLKDAINEYEKGV